MIELRWLVKKEMQFENVNRVIMPAGYKDIKILQSRQLMNVQEEESGNLIFKQIWSDWTDIPEVKDD